MMVAAAASNIAGVAATETLEDAKIQPIQPSQGTGEQPDEPGRQAYTPLRVVQESLAGGGVRASYGAISPAYVTAFNPSDPNANADGLVAMPNVDLATELINLAVAQRAYEASLKVVETEEEMSGSLLDALN
jgi:flagellar basal-body rod protein FlgC